MNYNIMTGYDCWNRYIFRFCVTTTQHTCCIIRLSWHQQ